MTLESNEQLLAVLIRIGILSPEQATEIRLELLPYYADPRTLADYLVEIDWLTSYQAERLFVGQWSDLVVGPYQILDRLGEGGVSEVLKAWDSLRGRLVALKVLRQHLATNQEIVRLFQREVTAIARLSHPNIIKTLDSTEDCNRHYFSMEFVEGLDLDRYVEQVGPLPVEQACDFARQVAHGLQHAHQNGLVHRDIKPANLFLIHPPPSRGPDSIVKIIDWGLARCVTTTESPNEETDQEKGQLVGTADFIAPEQARDARLADIRADIYSLGCTMYFLLTGHAPFAGSSLMQKLLHHQETEPASLRHERPDLPLELDTLILRMLAKRPEDRPQIPLMVVTPLRRFCTALPGVQSRVGLGRGSGNGCILRPGPGTTTNLPRPATRASLPRPGTESILRRPGPN